MFNLFQKDSLRVVSKSKRVVKRGRKTLSKRTKGNESFIKRRSVAWKTLRTRFDLTSPRALIDTLRSEGNMIYINKTAKGTSYRMGVPTKAIIAAEIKSYTGLRMLTKMRNSLNA